MRINLFRMCRPSPGNTGALPRRGQMAITLVLGVLMLLMIIIPVLDRYVSNEAKWGVKERKSSLAFHLAEAGADRGYWKLKENSDNWDTVAGGGSIAGYNDDVDYTDIEGGSYRVRMEQGDTATKVDIIATGKDYTSNEYRAIKVVYSKEGITAALQAGSVSASGNVAVHWGPMMSVTAMVLKGSSNELYPRKYARGSITAVGGYADRDSDPDSPNKGPYTGSKEEWWSYNEPPGVPDVLTPDTSYYMSLAKSQTCTPAGTQGCYYEGNQTINSLVDTNCTDGGNPKTRYFTGDLTLGGNKYFCGVLIVMGDLTITGGAANAGKIAVTPPDTAWKEYQCNVPTHDGETGGPPGEEDMRTWTYEAGGTHPSSCSGPHGDTAAVDEYPGDAGYHAVSEYNFYTGRTASGHCGLGNSPSFGKAALCYKGYIYTAGDLDNGGGCRFFGSVNAAGPGGLTGGGDIFYDSSLNITFLNDNITRESWYEVSPVEF